MDDCRISAVLARPAELSKQEKNSDLPNVCFLSFGFRHTSTCKTFFDKIPVKVQFTRTGTAS